MKKIKELNSIVQIIEEERQRQNFNISKFAKRSGMARSHYYAMVRHDQPAGIEITLRMLNVLGLSLFVGNSLEDKIQLHKETTPRKPKNVEIAKAKKKIIINVNL